MAKTIHSIPICTECKNDNRLFACLTQDEKIILSSNKGKNLYKKGQVIFYEGNHPHGLFCIYTGKVKLSKLGNDGKEQIIRLAGDGDILGYRSMLCEEAYKATASALEDSLICNLSHDNFFDVMKKNSDLSMNIIKKLSHDLQRSEQCLLNLTHKTVRERVSEALLMLRKKFGVLADGRTLTVTLTRREISDIAGLATETTIRMLSDFSKEGIINLNGKKIELLNLSTLITEANLSE